MRHSVHDLLRATQGKLIDGFPSTEWDRVSIDTRTLRPGNLFFAIHGPRLDGHTFLKVASEKRASALVIDRLDPALALAPYTSSAIIQVPDTLRALQDLGRWKRQRPTQTIFIGLTGSNGKTTTKEMLTLILRRVGKTLSTRGNLNNHIGLPLMLTELNGDEQFALLELGTSVPGDMDLLLECLQPTVGIITNVGKDHLEFFGTPEGVLKENRKLYDRLGPDGISILNLDDPLLKACADTLKGKRVTFALSSDADVSVEEIRVHPAPLRFTLRLGKSRFPIQMQTQGQIQAINAMAAAACAYALGISPENIVSGLQAFKASAMRMEALSSPDGAMLVQDAYNANPSSMRAAIDSFCSSYPDRPRWLVLADMRELGPGARQEHSELGVWLSRLPIDRLYLYGRDARFIEQGVKASSFKGAVERFHKKRYLVESLRQALQKSSQKPAVLFKASRRMKLEQVSHALSSLSS